MQRIHVAGRQFCAGRRTWRAWGMNWGLGDHSPVITYFDDPTPSNLDVLVCELHTARLLGANSMRIYLELGQVMQSPTRARPAALKALRSLLAAAERERVYLDITGNLVWRPDRAPAWYDRLPEQARWQVQANFWRAVARTGAGSPAVLCYELTSEPAISEEPGYYGGEFGGWTFLQTIAHPHGRDAQQLARAWTRLLATAVRSQDGRPVTIGMLPGLEPNGFSPENVADQLDMLTVHEYPQTGRAAESVAIVQRYASYNKPLLLGETYMLTSDALTMRAFLSEASRYFAGVFEFFDGRNPDDLAPATSADTLYQTSLRQFIELRNTILNPR